MEKSTLEVYLKPTFLISLGCHFQRQLLLSAEKTDTENGFSILRQDSYLYLIISNLHSPV